MKNRWYNATIYTVFRRKRRTLKEIAASAHKGPPRNDMVVCSPLYGFELRYKSKFVGEGRYGLRLAGIDRKSKEKYTMGSQRRVQKWIFQTISPFGTS